MKPHRAHISRGGQISIPASIRHRWGAEELLLEDRGDEVVLRPLPADPLAEARGSLRLPPGLTGERMRRQARREDAAAEEQRRPTR